MWVRSAVASSTLCEEASYSFCCNLWHEFKACVDRVKASMATLRT
jgi:hypothetical protein